MSWNQSNNSKVTFRRDHMINDHRMHHRTALLLESVYYALVKTGNDGCSKDCFPRLSLFGPQQQQPTTIQLKPIDAMRPAASLNNLHALEKGHLDLFQWRDANIGHIERIHLVVTGKHKPSKCQWNIEWVLVIHHGYTFSGLLGNIQIC